MDRRSAVESLTMGFSSTETLPFLRVRFHPPTIAPSIVTMCPISAALGGLASGDLATSRKALRSLKPMKNSS
jgi:hypothetical protein